MSAPESPAARLEDAAAALERAPLALGERDRVDLAVLVAAVLREAAACVPLDLTTAGPTVNFATELALADLILSRSTT
jgi:hypothetical protein